MRLTNEAHARLKAALVKKWEAEGCSARFTRETRADLLGLSIKTANRIWSGELADRASFAIAFRNLSLSWDESYCELDEPRRTPSARGGEDQADFSISTHLPGGEAPPIPVASTPRAPARKPRLLYALGGVLAAAAVTALFWSRTGNARRADIGPSVNWRPRFYKNLLLAKDQFNAGDYEVARELAEQGVHLAISKNSAADLACSLPMRADLYAEEGDLHRAKATYEVALKIRETMGTEACLPPLQEAIGDVETRMGDLSSAETTLSAALTGFERFKDPTGVCMTERDLGSVAYERHDMAKAMSYFEDALRSLKRQPEAKPELVSDIHARQALVLVDQRHLDQARAILEDCLRFWQAKGQPRWVALTQYQLGLVEKKANHNEAATRLLSESQGGYRRIGDRLGENRARSELITLGVSGGTAGLIR